MAKTNSAVSIPVARTSAGLRDALFDELDALRAGTSNPTRANAVAKIADQVVNTVHMELAVRAAISKQPDTSMAANALGNPLSLSA